HDRATTAVYPRSLHDALPIFADGTHAPVAQMIDVVDLAAAVLELDQHLDDREDVRLAQRAHRVRTIDAQAGVHLDTADGRQVVRSEEHTSELQSRENLVCRLL